MTLGNIVLLNGTSSAGKSTIARALQEMMEEPYLHSGIDHFLRNFPQRLVMAGEGWQVTFAEDRFMGIEILPLGYHLLAGMYRAMVAIAEAGIDVIVDDVIYDERVLETAVSILHNHNALFVGIHCPLAVAEQREIDRGDRSLGGAQLFYDKVHRHGIYDLVVDSSAAGPLECAQQIKQVIRSGQPRMALGQLWQRLQAGNDG